VKSNIADNKVDISSVVDNARIGSFQVRLYIVSAIGLIIAGFDVQVLGYIAPALIQEWKIAPSAMGPVFAATNLGVMIGALVFSMVADKIGRRPVLTGATLFFGLMTLVTASVNSVSQLLVLRLIAGIGMGCIIPNSTALIGEYSPQRKRVTLMMSITVGFTFGAAIAGFLSAWLIEDFGWRTVFYFGGIVPLVAGLAMLLWLPESLQFLVLKSRNSGKVAEALKRIDSSVKAGPGTEYVVREENKRGVPIRHLFAEGRSAVTVLFWILNFMNVFSLYSLSNWLPTLMRDAGYSTTMAVLVGSVLQVGGTLGAFGLAWLISSYGFLATLTTSFIIACVSIALIGQMGLPLAVLGIVVFVAGWCVIGGQPGLNALSATYYPTYLRSTGIGAGLGVGRLGGILGPVLGGILIAKQWSNTELFFAAAIPSLIAAMVMVGLRVAMKPK
jgi:AAHS family 4-hydroxybenzoate transporter-like MFS transporter